MATFTSGDEAVAGASGESSEGGLDLTDLDPGRHLVGPWLPPVVGQCRLMVSKPVLKASMISALEAKI